MATYRIEWKASALREIRRLDKAIIPRIISAVGSLAKDPFTNGIRKLYGAEHTYRLRVGDYRVIYEIYSKQLLITIIRVRHRREVYRK